MVRTLTPFFVFALAVIVACPLAAQEEKPAAKTVTFTKKAPAAGDFYGSMDKTESTNTTEMARDGEAQEPRKSQTSSTINREVTILAAKGEAVTRAQVVYKKVEQVRPERGGRMGGRRGGGRGGEGGGARAQVTDLAGQTFILDFSGETPKVTDAKGEAVAENLSQLVLRRESRDSKFTGWGRNMIDVIGKTSMTVGESIALDRSKVTMLMGNDRSGGRMGRMGGRRGGRGGRRGGQGQGAQDRPETMKASLTLKGTKKVFGVECAEFELKVTDNSSMDNERMSRESKSSTTGTVLIGVDNGWLYSVKVNGSSSSSMSGSMRDSEFEMESSGTRSVNKQVIYSKKPVKSADSAKQ